MTLRRVPLMALVLLVMAGGIMALTATRVDAAPPAPRSRLSVDGPVDVDELLQVARIRAGQMASTFYKYTFRQTVTEEDLNEDGSVKRRETRVYDVIPAPDGTERRLVSTDGEPPTAAETRKQEKRNAALKKHWERIRAKQAKAAAEARAKKEAAAASTPSKPAPAKPAVATKQPGLNPTSSTGSAGSTAESARPAPTAPATPSADAVAAPPRPPIAQAPIAPATPQAAPEPRVDLPPLPACNLDDLASGLRPALPGSITHTRRTPVLAPEEARRSRDKTSDYSLWELLQLTDYDYAGACQIDGRPMHVLTFEPPETFDAVNPVERVMTAMSGTLLLDGLDIQVSRAEGLTVAPITWGAGMVKLKQAHVLLEYAKVQGEIWLPSRDVFEFDTRVILKHESQRFTHVFDDFRKASVEVAEEYDYQEETPAP